MRTATVSEAKERLEELIEAVRAGEAVEITSGGSPVAALVPRDDTRRKKKPEAAADLGKRLSALEARGLITPSRGGLKPQFPQLPEPIEGSGAVDALIADRRAGR